VASVTLTDNVAETFEVAITNNAALANPANDSITVSNAPDNVISQTGWTLLFVDSQETVGANAAATNSFDGTPATHWTTRWSDIDPDPPHPHEIQINLGAAYDVSGLRYLPRQDGASNGRIGQYEFYVSQDGVTWGSPVATGTFANTSLEKEILFAPKSGQYVRLRALSEVNGNPWTSMAELNVLQAATGPNQAPDGAIDSPTGNTTIIAGSAIDFTSTGTDPDNNTPLSYRWSFGAGAGIPDGTVEDPGLVQFDNPGTFTVTLTVSDALGLADATPATRTITVLNESTPIPQTDWTLLFVDSQETVGVNGAGTNSFDGDPATRWVTQWFNIDPDPPPPHEIQIDLGAVHSIGGFRYLPRQDGVSNGRIGQYEFYISSDGVNWGSPVASGTFANDMLEKEVTFIPKRGQYVRLRALSEVNGNPWTTMAELNVLQTACITPSVSLVQPQSYFLQTSADLFVSAEACLATGQGVRLMIDGGTGGGGGEFDDYAAPYEVIFTGSGTFEHVVDAFVIDSVGTVVPGIAAHDQSIQVGIGDYYVAMGDSIIQGFGDNIPFDDVSQDGRNTGGGFTPILDDLLTTSKGIPHTVVNEGVGGAKSAGGASLISTLLASHPNAQQFLIIYGTNDANIILPVPSGLGLQPGDAGYPGSFKDNMQQIIDAINAAGKVAVLAKAPVALPVGGARDTLIQEYNLVIDELVAIPANNILTTPPDFHTYFETAFPTEYFDDIHPNGSGYQSMAGLYILVIP
jgi:lysophospholipase L1-like esterase